MAKIGIIKVKAKAICKNIHIERGCLKRVEGEKVIVIRQRLNPTTWIIPKVN